MKLAFIQLAAFVSHWRQLKLTDNDLRHLETALLANPQAGNPVSGTGGLRKLRFAPPSFRTGKSGGTRVGYAYFPDYGRVYLVTVYAKNRQANLTAEQKSAIRGLLKRLAESLADERRE